MNMIPEALPTLSSGSHQPGDGKACVMEYVALLAGESWTDSPSCTHPVLASAAQRVNDGLSDKDRHLLVPLIGRLFGTSAPVDELEAKRLSVALAIWCADRVADLVRPQDHAVARAAIDAARRWVDEPTEANANAADAAYAAAYAAYAAADAAANAAAYAANAADAAYAAAYAAANAAAYAAAYAANAAAYAAYAAAANAAADDAAADAAAYAANAAANAAAANAADDANAAANAEERVAMLSGLIDEYDRLTGRNKHREVTQSDLASLRDRVAELAR